MAGLIPVRRSSMGGSAGAESGEASPKTTQIRSGFREIKRRCGSCKAFVQPPPPLQIGEPLATLYIAVRAA